MAGPRKRDKESIRGNLGRARFKAMPVATDFTPGAIWAAGRAALLPLVPGAKVRLLHALPDGMPAELHVRADKDARRFDPLVVPGLAPPVRLRHRPAAASI